MYRNLSSVNVGLSHGGKPVSMRNNITPHAHKSTVGPSNGNSFLHISRESSESKQVRRRYRKNLGVGPSYLDSYSATSRRPPAGESGCAFSCRLYLSLVFGGTCPCQSQGHSLPLLVGFLSSDRGARRQPFSDKSNPDRNLS